MYDSSTPAQADNNGASINNFEQFRKLDDREKSFLAELIACVLICRGREQAALTEKTEEGDHEAV